VRVESFGTSIRFRRPRRVTISRRCACTTGGCRAVARPQRIPIDPLPFHSLRAGITKQKSDRNRPSGTGCPDGVCGLRSIVGRRLNLLGAAAIPRPVLRRQCRKAAPWRQGWATGGGGHALAIERHARRPEWAIAPPVHGPAPNQPLPTGRGPPGAALLASIVGPGVRAKRRLTTSPVTSAAAMVAGRVHSTYGLNYIRSACPTTWPVSGQEPAGKIDAAVFKDLLISATSFSSAIRNPWATLEALIEPLVAAKGDGRAASYLGWPALSNRRVKAYSIANARCEQLDKAAARPAQIFATDAQRRTTGRGP